MNSTKPLPRPVRIVTVAYGSPDLLRLSLASVGRDFPVTVVDNSSDPAVRAVADEAGAQYIDPGRNLGFGAGVNRVLSSVLTAGPTDVLLLNPDAAIEAADLRRLAATLHRPENSDLGMLSPRLVGPDDRPQRELWPFPSPALAWQEALGLHRIRAAEPSGAQFAVGAVLLLRWETITMVGLFDERFFLYAEETDWQLRAHRLGWRAGVDPQVVARHHGGATSRDERRRSALFHAGGETYQRKWHGNRGWQLYRAAVLTGCLPRLLHPSADTRHKAGARARLYLRGPRRVAGMRG